MGGEQAPLSGPDLTKGVPAGDVVEGQMLLGHAEGEPVVLVRRAGELFAVGARCPHYGGPLNEGLVVGDTIRCPWHHAAFDLRTGAMVRPPALGDIPCWRVEERDGVAVVTERRPAAPHSTRRTGRAPGGAPESVVILGGGAAGVVAAETLRR